MNHQSTGGRSGRTQEPSKNSRVKFNNYICSRALPSFLSFAHCRAASTVTPLLPTATFTPSIQPNLGPPRIHTLLTSAVNNHFSHMLIQSLYVSGSRGTISFLLSTRLADSLSISALLCSFWFLNLSICDTPTKLLKHLKKEVKRALKKAVLNG